jgi:hypothetical protein
MPGKWAERMKRLGKANQEARDRELREMTVERATQVLEGLLSNPATPPRKKRGHPVSLSHRMRRRRNV